MQFTPSVYEHAAALIGRSPLDVSRDPDLLFEAHAAAYRLYRHSPVVVGIDIYNLEAEAYGAVLDQPSGNGIPSVSGFPCPNPDEIINIAPLDPEHDGRIPMVLAAGERLARAFPEADIRIPVSGPFSLAGNLAGFDALLCHLLDAPDLVVQTLNQLARGQVAFCRTIIKRGLGVAFFESGATPPLVSPALFATVVRPVLAHIMQEAAAMAGNPVPCVIGGDSAPILEEILSTGTGYVVCPFETDQHIFMRKMREHPAVMVRVNTDMRVFTVGDRASLYREMDRVLTLATGRDRVCIGTGALPFEARPEMVMAADAYLCTRMSAVS